MKYHIFKQLWLMASLAMLVSLVTSCSDDDNNGGQPVIESVRVTDPALVDSTFTQAVPGKMIVIQGHNLSGAKALYINNQKVNFNPNMNTDHSLIAKIPTEADGFVLTAWDSELPAEIRVVTPGGEARYDFRVLAPTPTITRIAGRYPRMAGDRLTVYGTNFLDVTRVYFDDINPLAKDPETGELPSGGTEVDIDVFELTQNRYFDEKSKTYISDSEMQFTLPQLPYSSGYIIIETPQGSSALEYASVPPAPVLTGISSDMPIPGSRVTMKGTYFIDVTGIKIGDNRIIPAEDIDVAENESELSFIMPEKPTETTTISVVTPGGESNSFRFYCYETLLIDFDSRGKNLAWDPDCDYRIASPDAEPYVSDNKFAVYDLELTAYNYWGTMIYFESSVGSNFQLAGYDVIPADTPAEDIYLQFECYNKYRFTKFMDYLIRKADGKDLQWNNRDGDTGTQIRPEFPSVFGEQPLGEWYTAVFPMTTFEEFQSKTYADIVETGIKRIRIMLKNQSGEAERVFICVDNIRLSTIPSFRPEE